MHECREDPTIAFKSASSFSLGAFTLTLLDAPPGLSSSPFGGRRGIVPRILPRPARLSSRSGLMALKAEIDLAATLQKKMPDRSSPPRCPPLDTSHAQSEAFFATSVVSILLCTNATIKMVVCVCFCVFVCVCVYAAR